MLLAANPDGARVKDVAGCLPLAYACRRSCECKAASAVPALVAAYPRAACVRNDDDGLLPLHALLLGGGHQWDGVLAVLAAHPRAAQRRTDDGFLPLTLACAQVAREDVILALLAAHPAAAHEVAAASRAALSETVQAALASAAASSHA